MDTPTNIYRGMTRLWDEEVGIPSSSRIIEDVNRAIDAFYKIAIRREDEVEGSCVREGQRNFQPCVETKKSWGGKRIKGTGKQENIRDIVLNNDMIQHLNKNIKCLKNLTTDLKPKW